MKALLSYKDMFEWIQTNIFEMCSTHPYIHIILSPGQREPESLLYLSSLSNADNIANSISSISELE